MVIETPVGEKEKEELVCSSGGGGGTLRTLSVHRSGRWMGCMRSQGGGRGADPADFGESTVLRGRRCKSATQRARPHSGGDRLDGSDGRLNQHGLGAGS